MKTKQEPAPIIVAAPDRAPQKPASPLKNNKNNVDEDAALTKYMSNLYDDDADYVEKSLDKFTELFSMGFDNPFLNMILMKKFQGKVQVVSNYLIEGQLNKREKDAVRKFN